jgi:site-specific DNA recombinase
MPPAQSELKTPADQWLPISVPALVDADLFATVQAQLEENRRHVRAGREGVSYLLQGLVVCKQCGYAYCGRHCSKTGASGQRSHYWYYRCTSTDASRFGGQRACTNTQVRTDCLDQAVWQQVCALLNDPQRLIQEYGRRLQVLTQPANEVTHVALAKQLRQCAQGITRLIDAYTDGYLEKSEFESRMDRLRERRHALERQQQEYDEAAVSKAELQLIIGRLEDFAAKVRLGLDEMDFSRQRELIRTLVKRVEIDREQVNVVFRVESILASNSLSDCGNGAHGL